MSNEQSAPVWSAETPCPPKDLCIEHHNSTAVILRWNKSTFFDKDFPSSTLLLGKLGFQSFISNNFCVYFVQYS